MSTFLDTNLVRTPDTCGGRLRIDGTRMTVNQIRKWNEALNHFAIMFEDRT